MQVQATECDESDILKLKEAIISMNLIIDYISLAYNLMLFHDMITDNDAVKINEYIRKAKISNIVDIDSINCINIESAKSIARTYRRNLERLCRFLQDTYNDTKCMKVLNSLVPAGILI